MSNETAHLVRTAHAGGAAVPGPAQAAADKAAMHFNSGNALQMQGKLDAAIECYRNALALRPEHLGALNNLGNALQIRGHLHAAIECYRKMLALQPDHAEAWNNMGIALDVQGKTGAAIDHFRKALALKPDYAEAHNNLGLALQTQGRFDTAARHYREAIARKPGFAGAHNNLGLALWKQGKLDAAMASYREALALQPDYAEAHNNLGLVLCEQGKLDDAIASYRKALALKPDFVTAHSNMLLAMSYGDAPAQYLAEARRYGGSVTARARPYTSWRMPAEQCAPALLRIGMVSGDFRMHAVGFFLENILAQLDAARIELVAYSASAQQDALTARIKPRFAVWHNVLGLSDEAVARRIHADGIHILIDLAGHTADSRLPVFAWQPAPVQVSWLGYFASTGLPGMDYFLADPVSVPESHRRHFSETLWYLPDTRFCFTPPADSASLLPAPPPAVHNGYITFGSFQKLTKINNRVLALWGRIFHALPDARLRLQNRQLDSAADCEHLLHRLAGAGIAAERVIMARQAAREEYLAAHAEVDIILDTFPYTGATTTCEALWMGVPTLTLAGDTLLARQGASLLACAGLQDWIATDADDYVARAQCHAADVGCLAQLRAGLRQQVLASPLFDAPRFARHLEEALQGMWRHKMCTESGTQ